MGKHPSKHEDGTSAVDNRENHFTEVPVKILATGSAVQSGRSIPMQNSVKSVSLPTAMAAFLAEEAQTYRLDNGGEGSSECLRQYQQS